MSVGTKQFTVVLFECITSAVLTIDILSNMVNACIDPAKHNQCLVIYYIKCSKLGDEC